MQVVDDNTKRRLKRRLKSKKADAAELSQVADDKIDRLLIRRFDRLVSVRRFVLLWSLLFIVMMLATLFQLRNLGKYYQTLQPVPGGLYSEGIIGSFTDANPLFSSGEADAAVSHLVFSGLFKYDNDNKLVGDLATDWKLGNSPQQYIVHLRHGVKWQDGEPFTADDVVFTYKTIQNIEAQSPLYSSWQGIKVHWLNDYTVSFDLPNPLISFPYSLTNGIVPAHLLSKIPVEQLRSAPFNTQPIGTGPFRWKYVEVSGNTAQDRQQHITLSAYKDYWQGRPQLDGFSITTFSDDTHMVDAFEKKQINAMSGLEVLPGDLAHDNTVQTYVTPLTSAVMAFFNNSVAGLNDVKVRQALVSGVDRSQIKTISPYPLRLVDSPLLRDQLAYDPKITELPYDQAHANQLLDQDGWTRGADGYRSKNGQALSFTLVTQDSHNLTRAASFLQKQWAGLGVKVNVDYQNADDLQTNAISNHNYDILLYGISIGVDPDVYAYWDSSQASITSQGHLDLSEYKSAAADEALEGGRTRSDTQLRIAKYKTFLTNWKNDAPALALYQQNYLYITRGPVFNYQRSAANAASDRFYNVDQWEIRQQKKNI